MADYIWSIGENAGELPRRNIAIDFRSILRCAYTGHGGEIADGASALETGSGIYCSQGCATLDAHQRGELLTARVITVHYKQG